MKTLFRSEYQSYQFVVQVLNVQIYQLRLLSMTYTLQSLTHLINIVLHTYIFYTGDQTLELFLSPFL